MPKKFWIILAILSLIIAGSFYYFESQGKKESANNNKSAEHSFSNPDLKARYEDKEFGFFVDYPDSFKATVQDEEETRIIVFDRKEGPPRLGEAGGGTSESFQIFVMPFDEPGPITRERILIDQPKMVIKDPQEVGIGGLPAQAGEKALVFLGNDPDIGDTREVWFVHGDHLFQASTYAANDELLARVMKTFMFFKSE